MRWVSRWLLCAAVVVCLLSSAAMSSMAMGGAAGSASAGQGTMAGMVMDAVPAAAQPALTGDARGRDDQTLSLRVCGAPSMAMACGLKHGVLPSSPQALAVLGPLVREVVVQLGGRGPDAAVGVQGRAPPDLHALAVLRT